MSQIEIFDFITSLNSYAVGKQPSKPLIDLGRKWTLKWWWWWWVIRMGKSLVRKSTCCEDTCTPPSTAWTESSVERKASGAAHTSDSRHWPSLVAAAQGELLHREWIEACWSESVVMEWKNPCYVFTDNYESVFVQFYFHSELFSHVLRDKKAFHIQIHPRLQTDNARIEQELLSLDREVEVLENIHKRSIKHVLHIRKLRFFFQIFYLLWKILVWTPRCFTGIMEYVTEVEQSDKKTTFSHPMYSIKWGTFPLVRVCFKFWLSFIAFKLQLIIYLFICLFIIQNNQYKTKTCMQFFKTKCK